MAQDHFVAQTYLRKFGDTSFSGMLHCYRKSDGAQFSCRPADICREWNGDLNPRWLPEREDLLGQFRGIFEKVWNSAVENLLRGSCTPKDKFAIAGYVANLMTCTPAWRRIGQQLYGDHAVASLSFAKKMKEKHGGNPDLPVDGIAMLEKGEMSLQYDLDYIKAVSTRQLMQHAWILYHQDWVVISNRTIHPFLTSDNPVTIENMTDFRQSPQRFLSITPELGILIGTNLTKLPPCDLHVLPLGGIIWSMTDNAEAKQLNKRVARCAENLVISSRKSAGIACLVRNLARFRVELDFEEFPAAEPDAVYQVSIVKVRERLLS